MPPPTSADVEIQVPWGIVALKCWNSPELDPVLMIHGLSENAGAFDRLVPLLAEDFFYVVVDLPGHGYSSPFPKGFPLDFMAYVSQVQRIVNHFRWKKVTLVGHSFGAHLAEFYAATYTSKVDRLVLLDAVSPTPVPGEFFLVFHRNEWRRTFETETKASARASYAYEEAMARMTNGRMTRLNPEAAERILERGLLRAADGGHAFATDPRATREIRPALPEDIILEQLKRIKCPILVILAEGSMQAAVFREIPFYGVVLEILKKTNPASSVERVPGNHCVHNNEPEVVAPIINRFLLHQKSKM